MKLDPGFPDHWKTRQLYNMLGAEAILAVLRLWGRAQISREWQRLELTPKKLKAVCAFPGSEDELWKAFTDPDCPWLDHDEDGTFSIHGFEEHQAQVIALWRNGKKGGRPSKKPTPTLTHSLPLTPHGSHTVSSFKPNENHLVSDEKPPVSKSQAKGTLEELKAFAVEIGLPASDGEFMFNHWSANGWKNGTNPSKDWKAGIKKWQAKGWLPSQDRSTANGSTPPPAGTVMVNGRVIKL